MKVRLIALACALLIAGGPASAQTLASISAPATNAAVLRVGTKVPMKMAETLSTEHKQLRVGQRFQMEVAEAVIVDGQTVIPVGTPATGEVTDVRNKGMWGKSGHLAARVLYITVNGRQVRMSGSFDDKGVTGTAGVVGAIAFVPIAGFVMTGTSAKVPLGAPVTGFVDEDVPLAFTSSAPAPMVVGAPAPVSTSAAPVLTSANVQTAR